MRKFIIPLVIAVIVFSIIRASDARESQAHCRGYRIVSLGDVYEDVLDKCGPPDDYSYSVNAFGVKVAIELRYDRGGGQFPVYLFFDFQRGNRCTGIRFGSERN